MAYVTIEDMPNYRYRVTIIETGRVIGTYGFKDAIRVASAHERNERNRCNISHNAAMSQRSN